MCTMIRTSIAYFTDTMTSHKMVLFCCALLTMGFTNMSFADEILSRIIANQRIVIAHREFSQPFSYLNQHNQPIGLTMDICGKIVERIQSELQLPQLKINYVLVNTINHIKVITNKKADIECGTTPNTSSPNRLVDFSIPYFFSSTRMMVHTNSTIKEWENLHHKKIAYVSGSNSLELIRKNTTANLKEMLFIGQLNDRMAFDNLATNQVSAFISDEVSLYKLKAGNPKPEQFMITGKGLGVEAFAIMMPNNSPQLKKIVNTVIDNLMASGQLNLMYEKWFMKPIPPHQINFQFPMNILLRDSIRSSSQK